jgi:uridine phosphorylase
VLENQVHIHPTAELAGRVLLPGDPGRAMRLAQTLLDEPKMFNHNRGLWGYTGIAQDGHPLTIQSTGMGGPSAAIVISELITLGAATLLRVGTCGALVDTLPFGRLTAVTGALADDGTSRALSGAEPLHRIAGSPALSESLLATGAEPVTAVTTDLFYDAEPLHERWRAAGAEVVEMESAALFALARLRGVEAGCLLLVSDRLVAGHTRIAPEPLAAAELELGELAVLALARA